MSAGPEHWFDIAMREVIPNLDNVTDVDRIGAFGLEAPGACTCPDLPGEHTEDECAAEGWKQVRS